MPHGWWSTSKNWWVDCSWARLRATVQQPELQVSLFLHSLPNLIATVEGLGAGAGAGSWRMLETKLSALFCLLQPTWQLATKQQFFPDKLLRNLQGKMWSASREWSRMVRRVYSLSCRFVLENHLENVLCNQLSSGTLQDGSFVVFVMVLLIVPHLLFTLSATVVTC